MKAIVQNAYGSPDVLAVKEIDKPKVKDDGVLLRVHAAALHAGDYFVMRGAPYPVRFIAGWPKPKNYIPGFDAAGHVVLKELLETGKVTPVIDRTYRLSETPEALGYIGEGHARGKVVITVAA